MSWADYSRHMAIVERVLDGLGPPGPTASREAITDYAVAHALAAIAAVLDPVAGLGEGKIETREADTRQT